MTEQQIHEKQAEEQAQELEKINALAEYLGISKDEIRESRTPDTLETEDAEYIVLTDEEANKKIAEQIKDELWAFNADWILTACGLYDTTVTDHEEKQLRQSLEDLQAKSCESCNELIKAVIVGTIGLEKFIEAAIETDGRGHFLSSYDGHEGQQGDYYIYRTN